MDASATVAMLVDLAPLGARVRERLLSEEELHAPHLLDLEVLSVLRRFARTREIDPSRIARGRADYGELRIKRYPHSPMVDRIWQLRDNLTAYDASYVVLAEALDAPLLTCDARLAGASGHDARVELMG